MVTIGECYLKTNKNFDDERLKHTIQATYSEEVSLAINPEAGFHFMTQTSQMKLI